MSKNDFLAFIESSDCLSHDPGLASKLAEIDSLGLRYEYEERAAILEYDGGLNREDADRIAAGEILNRKPNAESRQG
jgi:hypothetical protein